MPITTQAEEKEKLEKETKTILLYDDELIYRETIAYSLKKKNYNVITISTIEELVAEIKRAGKIDCAIFCVDDFRKCVEKNDQDYPKDSKITSIELLSLLQTKNRELPAVLLSWANHKDFYYNWTDEIKRVLGISKDSHEAEYGISLALDNSIVVIFKCLHHGLLVRLVEKLIAKEEIEMKKLSVGEDDLLRKTIREFQNEVADKKEKMLLTNPQMISNEPHKLIEMIKETFTKICEDYHAKEKSKEFQKQFYESYLEELVKMNRSLVDFISLIHSVQSMPKK